jgi:hypothetical protein
VTDLEFAKHQRELCWEVLEANGAAEDAAALMYWTERVRELRGS